MSGNQLAVDGVCRNVRFVENSQVEQWIAKGVSHETGKIERRNFLTGYDLFDQRVSLVVSLTDQLFGFWFLQPSRLYQGAGETT